MNMNNPIESDGCVDVVTEDKKRTSRPFHEKGIGRFPERLATVIGDDSLRSFARASGLSEGVVRNYLRGETFPTLDRLDQLAVAGKVSAAWLATGDGSMHPGEGLPIEATPHSAFEEEFGLVPRLKVQVSAGHGAVVEGEEHLDRLAFRRKWLKREGFKESDLVAVVVKGDSMQPTLADGDTVLVNIRETSVTDGIYVIRIDADVFVKRLQHRFGGAVGVISDNKDYPDQELSGQQLEELTIIGRVVWMGGMM